jgi:hypothetical protein
LQAAIAIAQSQMARSFELRAALCLAKLYRAANRDADAHAVLAPAVEGFPPTRQFLEVTEAQTLLAALSESDAVKNAAALHQRRLQLQISLLAFVTDQEKAEMVASVPLGRLGTPDDLGNAAVFLASDDSAYATGIDQFVDGGAAQI